MYISHFLPSGNSVKHSIKVMAVEGRTSFCNVRFSQVLATGGGMTIYCLKNNLTGVNYFYFVVCWYDIGPVDMLTMNRSVTIRSRVLFCEYYKVPQYSTGLRLFYDQTLQQYFKKDLDASLKGFTMMTDCASNMAPLVGSSTSSKVPLNQRWVGCVSHQINTVMNHLMAAEDAAKSSISADVSIVKTLARIFKRANLNSDMPDGKRLIQ